MLKSGEELFLDGVTVDELSERLDCLIDIVHEPSRAQSLLDVLFGCEVIYG